MTIPIKNIYYLLSYAWNRLEESGRVNIDVDDLTDLVDLFAKILINGSHILLKSGIDRGYIEHTGEVAGVKGKLELSQTLKRAVLHRQRTICSYDDYSTNILANQLVYYTLYRLSRMKPLDRRLKEQSRNCLSLFRGVELIAIQSRHFSLVRLHRNNGIYRLLLDVCQLIHENSLPTEIRGEWTFRDFTRDERQMNRLFEAFVRRFYQIRLGGKYTVGSQYIKWQMEGTSESVDYLPLMKTDVSLENEEEKIIIDTKYYTATMNVYYDKEHIKAENLYQLFAYLLQQEMGDEKTARCKGILLYPTIDREYDVDLKYKEHPIAVRTVNLGGEWRKIERRLLGIL